MFLLISIISALLFTIRHISAQDKFDKDWRIGLTIPVMNAESHQKQMWTGISAAYKGYTINFYGVFSNNKSMRVIDITRLGVCKKLVFSITTGLYVVAHVHDVAM
jgi:hypothetical protein